MNMLFLLPLLSVGFVIFQLCHSYQTESVKFQKMKGIVDILFLRGVLNIFLGNAAVHVTLFMCLYAVVSVKSLLKQEKCVI